MERTNASQDLTALSERISAQIEAYVEMSNALVKIIEQIADIRDRIKDSSGKVDNEIKELNEKLHLLIVEFNKHYGDISNQNINFSKEFDSIKGKINHIEDSLASINKSNQNIIESISDKAEEEKHVAKNKEEDLKTIINDVSYLKSYFTKAIVFIAVFVGIATLLGFLTAANIINITWFPKLTK